MTNVTPPYGDDGRSGVYPMSGVPDQAEVAWVAETEAEVIASPVLAGDTLVVTDVGATVYTIDAITGERRWSHTHRDEDEFELGDITVQLPVAVWNDLVFVGVGGLDYDFDSFLHVHDLRTGELKQSIKGAWHPTVVGDVLLLHEINDGVRALNLPDLSPLWRKPNLAGWLRTPPAVGADGIAYAARGLEANRTLGGFDAFDVRSGKQVFAPSEDVGPSGTHAGMIQATHAVLADDRVWLPVAWGEVDEPVFSGGGVVGLDPRTGERRERHFLTGSWLAGAVTVADGTLYFAEEEGDGEPPILGRSITAVDIATEHTRWEHPVEGYLAGMPVLASGVLYGATHSGTVLAIDAPSGRPRWTLDLDTPIENRADLDYPDYEAVYEENGLVVLPGDGILYVRTSTGITALR